MEYKYNISPERHFYKNEQKRSISKTRTNKNSLIKKKFKLSSAFDHKGSKHFLNSKKIALQQIILDEGDCETENDTNEKVKDSKKLRKYSCKISLPNVEIKKHLKDSLNIDHYKKKINKRSPQKMKSTNDPFKRMFASSTNNQHYLSKKNLASHKFFSNQEIKMFEDKDIKKIKPIKNKEIKNENENENKNKNKKKKSNNIAENISFMDRNDSSIIDIITELK